MINQRLCGSAFDFGAGLERCASFGVGVRGLRTGAGARGSCRAARPAVDSSSLSGARLGGSLALPVADSPLNQRSYAAMTLNAERPGVSRSTSCRPTRSRLRMSPP